MNTSQKGSVQTVVISIGAILIVVVLGAIGYFLYKEHQSSTSSSSTSTTSPSDLLVPTATSIPAPYKLFLSQFQSDGYSLQYNSGNGRFFVSEGINTPGYNPTTKKAFVYNYQYEIASIENIGGQEIENFTYDGLTGSVLQSFDKYGNESDNLLLEDGPDRVLDITNSFGGKNPNFSANYLIDILKTFVRRPSGNQSQTILNPIIQ